MEDNHAEGKGIPSEAETNTETTKVNLDKNPIVKEKPALEPLGPKEAYFEAPDGNIFKGPTSETSIRVRGYDIQINRMRGRKI